jgi:cobalt-zinc-cadmium efflux system protein
MHMHARPPHKVLFIAIFLTLGFGIVEAFGGWWSGSLALLGDAGHMGSDSLALAISAFAAWIAIKPPSDKHTFGLGRAEVLAAWFSSLLMFVISIAVLVEAIKRFQSPHEVKGGYVMVIAFIGLLINLYIAWLLSRSEQTINVRAAMLHVLSDVLGSVAALVSGAVIYYTGWLPIDPILSILISILIMLSSIQLLRESMSVLMEGVPRNIDINQVSLKMQACDQVLSIHDLHIWTLSSGRVVLSSHVVLSALGNWDSVLSELRLTLRNKFHIEHVTLQPELNLQAGSATVAPTGCACPADPPHDKEHNHDGHHH